MAYDPNYRYSIDQYKTDGTDTTYVISFAGGYIRQSDVKAYSVVEGSNGLSGDRLEHDVVFVSSSPNSSLVKVTPVPAVGRTLFIYRDTEKATPLVDYSAGSVLTEDNLDLANKQATFNAAEFTDRLWDVERTARVAYDSVAAAAGDYNNLQYLATKDEVSFLKDTLESRVDQVESDAQSSMAAHEDRMRTAAGAHNIGYRRESNNRVRPVQEVIAEGVASIADFSDPANTDHLPGLQQALAQLPRGGQLYLPNRRWSISAEPYNPRGIRFVGPGALVAPTPISQINTRRYDYPIGINRENLWRVFQVLEKTNRAINVYTYGDSTVAGGYNYIDDKFFLQKLLPDMASAMGVQNAFNVVNRGVGGSNLSTWNPLPDIGTNSSAPADLVILKCGINDAFPEDTRLQAFENRLRAGLEAIRNAPGGAYGDVSILLVGPNTVYDNEFDSRNTRWFEQLRPIFEAAARDFKCAYFDAYAYLQDSRSAAGRWLDQGSGGTGLHPTNVGHSWIWGGVMDFIFNRSELLRWKTNQFHNLSQYRGWRTAKLPPDFYLSNYPPGITMEVALVSDGWPITGVLRTVKHADGLLEQTLFNSGTRMERTGNSGDGNVTPWRGAKVALTFLNNWSNFGSSYRTAGAMVGMSGEIILGGLVKPGSLSQGVTFAHLPPGFRPVNQHLVASFADTGPCLLEFFGNGDIALRQYSGTPQYVSLSGIVINP